MKNVACCSPLDCLQVTYVFLFLVCLFTVWRPQRTAVVHPAADQRLIRSLGNAAGDRVTHRTLSHSHDSITLGYDAVYLAPP